VKSTIIVQFQEVIGFTVLPSYKIFFIPSTVRVHPIVRRPDIGTCTLTKASASKIAKLQEAFKK
jgi:hypothetical protein